MSCVPLNQQQRALLQRAAIAGDGSLDSLIAQLRTVSRTAFHCGHSLRERRFFDEPILGEPCAGFVRGRERSPVARFLVFQKKGR